MKRIVCVLAVVVMLLPIVGIAETQTRSDVAKMYKEYCESILESLCDLYDMYGDKLDDDYVELTYKYYQLWNAVKDVYSKELQFDVKDLVGSSMVFGINNDVSYAWTMLNRDIEERWTKYIEGETAKNDFMGMLTRVIRAQLDAQKEPEAQLNK